MSDLIKFDGLKNNSIQKYSSNYSEDNFWTKFRSVAKRAGAKVGYACLLLFYTLIEGDVPLKQKAIVVGALGYYILPIDLMPDFIPAFGYADDLVALIWAVKSIYQSITPEIKEMAKAKVREVLGEVKEEEFILF